MWVRVWLWVRAVCRVCLCVCARMSGWNMWVFVGELDDFCRHWFTPGHPCPGLLKTCWVLGIGNGAQLQDHAKAPWGLTGVADADKVRKSAVFYVDSKNCVWVFAPRKCCHCSFSLSCCYPEKISVDFYQTNTCTQTNSTNSCMLKSGCAVVQVWHMKVFVWLQTYSQYLEAVPLCSQWCHSHQGCDLHL